MIGTCLLSSDRTHLTIKDETGRDFEWDGSFGLPQHVLPSVIFSQNPGTLLLSPTPLEDYVQKPGTTVSFQHTELSVRSWSRLALSVCQPGYYLKGVDDLREFAAWFRRRAVEPSSPGRLFRGLWEAARVGKPYAGAKAVREYLRLGLHGARCAAFASGWYHGDVRCIDLRSAYGWALTEPLPHPGGMQRGVNVYAPGVSTLDLEMGEDNSMGAEPGRARTVTMPNCEIVHALERGAQIVGLRYGVWFPGWERRPDLDRTFKTLDGWRQETGWAFFKHAIVQAYGLFGHRGLFGIVMWRHQAPTRAALTLGRNGELVIAPGRRRPWADANVVWAAYASARCRMRLQEELERLRAEGSQPLWCHTDSIVYLRAAAGREYPAQADMGQWAEQWQAELIRVENVGRFQAYGGDGRLVKRVASGEWEERKVRALEAEREGLERYLRSADWRASIRARPKRRQNARDMGP